MKALLTALRYRRFRRVWGGQLVNIVGDAVFAAVGAIIGASIAASHKPARPGMVAMLALVCKTPQLVAIAAHAQAAVIVMLSGGAGFGLSIFAVLWTSALQSHVAANQGLCRGSAHRQRSRADRSGYCGVDDRRCWKFTSGVGSRRGLGQLRRGHTADQPCRVIR